MSYQAKKSSLRKVKTDAIDDAYQLCVLYYKEDLEPHKIRGIQLLDLRNLSRQQEIVTNMYIEETRQKISRPSLDISLHCGGYPSWVNEAYTLSALLLEFV
nr:IS110 family transposase [Peribacillus simplex]